MSYCSEHKELHCQFHLFDILWEDMIILKMSEYLSLKNLFNLRCCSQKANRFVEAVLKRRKEVDFSHACSLYVDLSFAVLNDSCRSIEKLDLSYNGWISDYMLMKLCKNNPRLQEINLTLCGYLTACGIQTVLECPQLRSLNIGNNFWFTIDMVTKITVKESKVKNLDISFSFPMVEDAFIIFLQKFPELILLRFSETSTITDRVLAAVATYCPSLEYLSFNYCEGISDLTIEMLAAGCKNLKKLNDVHL